MISCILGQMAESVIICAVEGGCILVQRFILLILVSVVGTPLWASTSPQDTASQYQDNLCGIIKSAYYKKDLGKKTSLAIVTLVSQSRVIKVFSEEVVLGFLTEMYPEISVNDVGNVNNMNNFRLTWSSSSMNDFHQICLQGIKVHKEEQSPSVEYVNSFSSYQLNIN